MNTASSLVRPHLPVLGLALAGSVKVDTISPPDATLASCSRATL